RIRGIRPLHPGGKAGGPRDGRAFDDGQCACDQGQTPGEGCGGTPGSGPEGARFGSFVSAGKSDTDPVGEQRRGDRPRPERGNASPPARKDLDQCSAGRREGRVPLIAASAPKGGGFPGEVAPIRRGGSFRPGTRGETAVPFLRGGISTDRVESFLSGKRASRREGERMDAVG